MNRKKLEQVKAETVKAFKRYRRVKEDLAARDGLTPAAGDIYHFASVHECHLYWLVTKVHPSDDKLVFVVPTDTHYLVGSADTALPREATLGPLIARPRYGSWVDRAVLGQGTRMAVLQDRFVAVVNEKIDQLGRGNASASEELQETDGDLDYRDWCDEVAAARKALSDFFGKSLGHNVAVENVVTLRTSDFSPSQIQRAPDLELRAAAADAETSSDIAALHENNEESPRVHLVECDLPGEFALAWEPSGIRVYYTPVAGEAPPDASGVDVDGEEFAVQWVSSPDGQAHRGQYVLPWCKGEAKLTIATESRKTVVIHNA